MKKQKLSSICRCGDCREIDRAYKRTQYWMIAGIAVSLIVYLFAWYKQI